MTDPRKAAEAYQAEQMTQGGCWCAHCHQRMGDPKNHFLAGYAAAEQRAIKAIDAEPELPGEMPDEMFLSFTNVDRETLAEMLRIIVRATKSGIKERLTLPEGEA